MRIHSHENKFDLHENEHIGRLYRCSEMAYYVSRRDLSVNPKLARALY